MNSWNWYVYIIECLDGSYYTGCTWNTGNRFDQHLTGLGSKYTGKHGLKRVAYVEQHNDLETALKREKQIKDWSQEKKEKLINGEWGNL